MNKDKQKIAIAEAVGWKFHGETNGLLFWYLPGQTGLFLAESLPDWLGSLDAMHEAEKSLTVAQDAEYLDLLRARHGRAGAILTTASERAEAFLRALGKWEPETK